MNGPEISVVIPTHNRARQLRRSLNALTAQTFPSDCFEVVVVADGCVDETLEMIAAYRAPYRMRTVILDGRGAAVARNRGAAVAGGRLLVFLDDDIEASPGLVAAHRAAHAGSAAERVVIGNLPYGVPGRASFYQMQVRAWFADLFGEMARPGHRFTYTDLLSGNFSISQTLFDAVGRFDEGMFCREDYELGARLIKRGVMFAYSADARGEHFDDTTLERALKRKAQEGRADVLIGRRHLELRTSLRLAGLAVGASRLRRNVRRSVFSSTAVGDALAAQMVQRLEYFERIRMRQLWNKLFLELLDYWYWRGVAQELGSTRALAGFLQEGPLARGYAGTEIEIDLLDSIDQAERRLDRIRPDGVRILYGGRPLGRIAPVPGAEALRGAHLRPSIDGAMLWPLMLERAWAEAATPMSLATKNSLSEASNHVDSDVTADESSNRNAEPVLTGRAPARRYDGISQ